MTVTNLHIINHTHWDREWFATSIYTSRWIPGLIDRLTDLAEEDPEFRYLFDGQTLVLEDLLAIAPDYREKMAKLVKNSRLLVGPYYCQPDWQLTSGELLIRNLLYGRQDVAQYGDQNDTGWLVDTFGHISQAAQIHRMFGIAAVFVWRGVPQLTPYFNWRGADGSELLTINLFGGYRNLYGVSHAPVVAQTRLNAEVDKLRPYYPTPDLPLFDGYDLEDNPENPVRFFTENGLVRKDLVLHESTPGRFARDIAGKMQSLPTIEGELNSGKYGATFPGTFSARTYLKIMARDCEQMLFQVCEPLAVMAALKGRPYPSATFETWGRRLLQNAVHDCICGVSVDQVHEKMEYSYRQTFTEMEADVAGSLAAILHDFTPNTYAVSTNSFPVDDWRRVGNELLHVRTEGVGVWPVEERLPIQPVQELIESLTWETDSYTATIGADGIIHAGDGAYGQLVVYEENGDTYSCEKGERLGVLRPLSPPVVVESSDHHRLITFEAGWEGAEAAVTALVRLQLDRSPLIKWWIDLDSHGKNLNIEMVFVTRQTGELFAGMPFDVVKRPFSDVDLLPRELDSPLSNVLLGQRELNEVTTFPFHDFVAIGGDERSVAVLARGLRSYDARPDGTIALTLRRSVEWLTAADLENRIGDAGPFFYVPDARCERPVRHELAVAFVPDSPDSMALQELNAAYQNPPLVVSAAGNGSETHWQLGRENAPLASLHMKGEAVLARFYNPTGETHSFSRTYPQTDVWGSVCGSTVALPPGGIQTVKIAERAGDQMAGGGHIEILAGPTWRVGDNHGQVETIVLEQLKARIATRDEDIRETEARLARCTDETEQLRLQHRLYVLQREKVEFHLSLVLNQRKMDQEQPLDYHYLYEPDQEIAEISLVLNRLRIKRRVFDYVVQAL